jgi:hypothetical protein
VSEALHTESRRRFRAAWIAAGGTVEDVRRTGEERYRHPLCAHPVRTNKRRKDVPAKLLSSYAAIRRSLARCTDGKDRQPGVPGSGLGVVDKA